MRALMEKPDRSAASSAKGVWGLTRRKGILQTKNIKMTMQGRMGDSPSTGTVENKSEPGPICLMNATCSENRARGRCKHDKCKK